MLWLLSFYPTPYRHRKQFPINREQWCTLCRISSTLTLISICRFNSPNIPPRHHTISCILMHSHILTKSPFLPHVVDLLVLSTYIFCTFTMSSEKAHNKRRFLNALLCTFYYWDEETIKMDAPGDFFFPPFTMHHPPALFSTGGSPSVWRLCRMDGKGKGFFSPVSVLQTSLQQLAYMESDCSCPCFLKGATFQLLVRSLDILNLIKSGSQFCNIDLKVISFSGCTT